MSFSTVCNTDTPVAPHKPPEKSRLKTRQFWERSLGSLGSFLAIVPSALKYSRLEGRGSHILVKKDQEVTEFTDPAPRLGKQLQGVQSPRWVGLSDDTLQTPNWFTNLDLVESFLGLISALLGEG